MRECLRPLLAGIPPTNKDNDNMKKIIAALMVSLAFAAPAAFAQSAAPVASAASGPVELATLAAANEMLASMNYRVVAEGMLAQMRQSMPAIIRQGTEASINNNPKFDASQKKAALEKMNVELGKVASMLDSVFNDPTMLDDLLRGTAQVYARHFTVDELRQIATFYKTPVGAKMLATMPQVMGESMQMGQTIVMPRIAAIMQKVQAN